MFNEERKNRFINKKDSEVTLAPGFLTNLFVKSAPFEEKLGKDLCEWTTTEIMEYYKYLDVYSYESLALMNSNYSHYTTWAITETLVPDAQNHFLEIDPGMLMRCVNTYNLGQTIITRNDLEYFADKIVNYTDRFVFYAIFEGIAGEQFCEITEAHLSDIDMKAKTMRLCTGRVVDVSDKLIDVARWAAEEDSYQAYGVQDRVLSYREAGTDLLFKTIHNKERNDKNNQKNNSQILSRRYIKGLESVGMTRMLTTKRLMMSGKLDYIKRLMKREGLTLDEVLRTRTNEIDERYPVERTKSIPIFMKKYGNYFKET